MDYILDVVYHQISNIKLSSEKKIVSKICNLHINYI